jgi:hypothetical protein
MVYSYKQVFSVFSRAGKTCPIRIKAAFRGKDRVDQEFREPVFFQSGSAIDGITKRIRNHGRRNKLEGVGILAGTAPRDIRRRAVRLMIDPWRGAGHPGLLPENGKEAGVSCWWCD